MVRSSACPAEPEWRIEFSHFLRPPPEVVSMHQTGVTALKSGNTNMILAMEELLGWQGDKFTPGNLG
jgi:hypothetical protein